MREVHVDFAAADIGVLGRVDASASSLCLTLVCDFTLPMCVFYPRLSLVCMILSTGCMRCL